MVKKSNPTLPKDIYGWNISQWKEFVEALESIVNSRKESHEKKLALINFFLMNMAETSNKIEKEFNKKLEGILKDNEITPYEKKLALFNMIKNLDVGDMSLEKKKRTNWLLQGHLYSELAKNCMEEYKKTTVESFSKAE